MTRELVYHLTKADFEIQTFRSGGPGGQHQNKSETGVRIVHRASGLYAESRTERSQYQNRQIAFNRLAKDPRLILWVKMQIAEKDGILAHAAAYADAEIANPDHTTVEVQCKGRWVTEGECDASDSPC